MHLIEIKFEGGGYYVPLVYPADMSTGSPRNLFAISPMDRLHVFKSIHAAQQIAAWLGCNNEIKLSIKIDMDKIILWARNPISSNINLAELENLEGLVVSIFTELDMRHPDDIDTDVILPLTQEIFYESRLAQYKHPGEPAVSQEDLQRKINNPILKKYYQTLIQHFKRVMYLNNGQDPRHEKYLA